MSMQAPPQGALLGGKASLSAPAMPINSHQTLPSRPITDQYEQYFAPSTPPQFETPLLHFNNPKQSKIAQ